MPSAEQESHDASRVVVSGARRGSVLPSSRAEMWRDIYLTTGADVKGGIWGNRLLVEGPAVRVDASVYVRSEIRIRPSDNPEEKRRGVTFGSTVTAGGTFLVEQATYRTRVLSNVYVGTASIANTVIYGNLYARSANIRNCVVMGGVFCRDHLQIENSVVATFQVGRATLGRNLLLLFPVALSQAPLAISHPVRAVSFLRLAGALKGAERGGSVHLGPDDVYAIDAAGGGLHALSLDQRIACGIDIVRRFEENRAMAELVSLADHLPDAERKRMRGAALTEYERSLFSLLEGGAPPELTGALSLSSLLERAEIVAGMAAFAGVDIASRVAERREDVLAKPSISSSLEGELPESIGSLFGVAVGDLSSTSRT